MKKEIKKSKAKNKKELTIPISKKDLMQLKKDYKKEGIKFSSEDIAKAMLNEYEVRKWLTQ